MSVRLKLKISVTTEPIEFYSSGYIPIGPVVVLSYFLEGWDNPNHPRNKNSPLPPQKNHTSHKLLAATPEFKIFFFLNYLMGAKPLEARGETASYYNSKTQVSLKAIQLFDWTAIF